MQFIQGYTSIPMPKVLDVWTKEDGCGVMVVEWMEGQNIGVSWPHLSTSDKRQMADQLKEHLDELHSLQQTTELADWIGTHDNQPFSGPFASYQEFN